MVKHIILFGSSYYNGTRIALDYTNVDKYYEDFPINANQLDNDNETFLLVRKQQI